MKEKFGVRWLYSALLQTFNKPVLYASLDHRSQFSIEICFTPIPNMFTPKASENLGNLSFALYISLIWTGLVELFPYKVDDSPLADCPRFFYNH